MRRIGLFGGTFDPVHNAHLSLARTALTQLGLDELRWIPAGQPWQKSRPLTAAARRADMVALAIAGEPRYRLERCELDRAGPSYTVETVRALQAAAQSQPCAQRDDGIAWYLLLGQDQYANLHTWQDWRELVGRVSLAVAARSGVVPQPAEVLSRQPHRMVVLPMPASALSSTEIRTRLAGGERAAALVPDCLPAAVAHYIDQHGLYGKGSAPSPLKEEQD